MFLSFGIVCLIASIVGFAAIKVKNRGVAIMYGVLLFPVWLVFMIAGISLLAVSYATQDVMEDICDGVNDQESDVVNLMLNYR